MVQIQITNISGGTYPIDVFISDVYGNNEYYLTGITTPVPPTVYYTTIIPPIFDTAPEILLKLVDANGCEMFERIPCSGPTPTPTPTITQTPTLTPGLSPSPTPTITTTPTTTPTITTTPTTTPTNTTTPTTTPTPTPTATPGLSPSPTPTITTTPTITPTITTTPTTTPTITPTITTTPTTTPTNTQTQTPTPTITTTPTTTPTNTTTPTTTPTTTSSPTPTPTQTNTETPTPTPTQTNTQTQTPTPTKTPTSTPSPIKALLFMESTDDVLFAGNPNTDLGSYMIANATSWYGFWTSGVAGINATDLLIYMDWPGFKNGTTNVPAVIEIEIPQTTGGFDSYGNSIEAYKFFTTEVTANTTTGNVWYSIFAPPIKTNNKVYSSIGINYANAPTTLVNTSTEPTVYVYNIGYPGINWINGAYRVYTQSAVGNGFNTGSAGVIDSTNNYFRGGTLI
jgi:hypothetical protein